MLCYSFFSTPSTSTSTIVLFFIAYYLIYNSLNFWYVFYRDGLDTIVKSIVVNVVNAKRYRFTSKVYLPIQSRKNVSLATNILCETIAAACKS